MLRNFDVRSWPVSWKAPLLATGLMIAAATMVSQVVMSRLAADQRANLQTLTEAYLDGISAAVIEPVVRGDVWETFDALDRARAHYAGVAARYVIVETPDGRVLAASEPRLFPVQSSVPDTAERPFPGGNGMTLDADNGRAWLARTLKIEGHSVGRILAEIDIAALLDVRRHVFWTLILVNAGMTLVFAAIAYVVLQRMLRPIRTLTGYVERVRAGRAELIPENDQYKVSAEFRRLFDRFNAMARALNEREQLAAQLAEQEKLAVLGKLASGMAHEVNNPLGGILNALDTLQRHGADAGVRASTIDLLRRGFSHIRNVVRSTLVTYKPETSIYGLAPSDLDDLRLLVEPEIARKGLVLEWRNELRDRAPISVGSVRQATLNLLLNACAASPAGSDVTFAVTAEDRKVIIEIVDSGPGLPPVLADYLRGQTDAAFSGGGLGLWIVRRLVAEEGGVMDVGTGATGGAAIRVAWPFRSDRRDDHAHAFATGEDFAHAG